MRPYNIKINLFLGKVFSNKINCYKIAMEKYIKTGGKNAKRNRYKKNKGNL